MLAAVGLRPLRVDELRHKKLREWLLNFVVRVYGEHAERSRRTVATGLHLQRQVVEVINSFATGIKQGSDVISEPETRKHILIGFACGRRKIALGNEHRQIGGDPVLMPHLHDVAHEFWLIVERAPGNSARIVGIVLKGEEREILYVSMLLEVVEKTGGP